MSIDPTSGQESQNNIARKIGKKLRLARRAAGLTQAELAERTGTKKSYISRIETGKSDIRISTFEKLIEQGLGKSLIITLR